VTHRALSPGEVIELAAGGLVEIGAHTVTHPALAELPAAAQRSEIEGSKTSLEEILGHTVTSFAYPYGSPGHYTAETTAIVKEAGFGSACSGPAGLVWRGADPFQLPRFSMRDWDGAAFKFGCRNGFGGKCRDGTKYTVLVCCGKPLDWSCRCSQNYLYQLTAGCCVAGMLVTTVREFAKQISLICDD